MSERTREVDRTRARSPFERYHERTARSRALFGEALEVMPGGNTRGVVYYPPYPAYLTEGDGAYVTDVDGNEYLDFLNNYTSLIHGHAPRATVQAAIDAMRDGSAPGGPTPHEIEWARHLVDRAPAIEQIRFTNSGTEATMNAIRAARAYTGGDVIAKFEGAYHGTHDDAQVSVHPPSHLAGPADDPRSVPDSAGVPESTRDDVIVIPMHDADAAIAKLERHREALAGVLVAPYLGSSVIPVAPAVLDEIASWTTGADVALIFDEVIAFRVAHGGAHAALGVEPDLVALGKIIGGGFPVGAFGGRTALMEPYDPRGGSAVTHSGTFNANPITARAGLATLERYDGGAVDRLNRMGDGLAAATREVAADRGTTLQVNQVGSLFNLYLAPTPVESYRDAGGHGAIERRLYHELLAEGVRLAPKLMGCLSTPMTDEDVDRFVAALDTALGRMRPTIEARAPDLLA